ncbi:MAG: 5-methyltetrahydrofolate--homocysteine methyltransferase [Arenicellales bacterium IbO2]|nr:MAG: 5-methyltetrahydrofolate--homocysteine methyltransferase [Arenicellales bacterium IbO2]
MVVGVIGLYCGAPREKNPRKNRRRNLRRKGPLKNPRLKNLLQNRLDECGVLLADGATGSNLFDAGLQSGDAPELWNTLHPERITRQYMNFIEAGSDIILTNTFGGSRFRLMRHDAAERVAEINRAGARLAKDAVESAGRPVIVAGSIGPTGEIMQPLGELRHEDAADAFAEQARALKEGGADVFWIETMSSREEVRAAVEGAARAELPIVATFSVDTNGRTMMGLAPDDIVALFSKMSPRPDAVGANCGTGASELVAATLNMRRAADERGVDAVLVAKANCGVPQYRDGKIVYDGDERIMAEYAKLAVDAGARIIGGCCGTTPSHVAAMRAALDGHSARAAPSAEMIERELGELSGGAKAQLRGETDVAAGALSERAGEKARRRQARGKPRRRQNQNAAEEMH